MCCFFKFEFASNKCEVNSTCFITEYVLMMYELICMWIVVCLHLMYYRLLLSV